MSEHHDLKVLLSMRGGYQEQAANIIADLQTENDQLRADKAELVEALDKCFSAIESCWESGNSCEDTDFLFFETYKALKVALEKHKGSSDE